MTGPESYGFSIDLQAETRAPGTQVSQLLDEANHAGWESLASALGMADGQPHPRVGRLVQHISVTKRGYWKTIADTLTVSEPPPVLDLNGVCRWEVERSAGLSAGQLATVLTYSGRQMSVAELLRLNARHTVWHAGQIAALCSGPKLA